MNLIKGKKADVEMMWIVIALIFCILGIVLALIISGKIANLANIITGATG